MSIQTFRIDIPQTVLDDLRERLADTRWTDEVEGAGNDYGTNLGYLKELTAYWQNEYDWRKHEAEINRFSQFTAEIDGLRIHFIHEKGQGENRMPVLLTHGWPDSFYRFHKVIPLLTAAGFDVVVPSIPGMGFSERPKQRGMNTRRIADLWAELMTLLGYEKFAAAGGDLGSEVTLRLGQQHPDRLIGIHFTDMSYPQAPPEGVEMDEAGGAYLERLGTWWMAEGAYAMLQSTKPQSLGIGLNDSPAGLAGWIVSFGGKDGATFERGFGSRDELLTNITIYWVTQTITSSARLYFEGAQDWEHPLYPSARIDVPGGVALLPGELLPPRSWVEATMDLRRWTEMPAGGHFAALEAPEAYAGELTSFFRSLRSS